MSKTYIYIFVRKDLPLVTIAVQASHASIEAARHFVSKDQEHPHLVLFGLNSEEQLRNAYARVAQIVRCKPFHEADLDDELTAFATEPVSEEMKPHFRRYQCLKSPKEVSNVLLG